MQLAHFWPLLLLLLLLVLPGSARAFSRVGSITLNSGENTPTCAVIDPANGFAYFGTWTSPVVCQA